MAGAVGAALGVADTGLRLIREYVNDPKRRIEAMQKIIDSLLEYTKELGDEDQKEVSDFIVRFTAELHSL